jgi:hypothetical protein
MLRNVLFSAAALGALATTAKPIYNILNKQPDKTQSFGWGNGYYQPKPGESGIGFKNFTPKLLSDFNDLKVINFSEHLEAGINSKAEALVWDAHRLSSSADPSINDSKRNNIIKLDLPVNDALLAIK